MTKHCRIFALSTLALIVSVAGVLSAWTPARGAAAPKMPPGAVALDTSAKGKAGPGSPGAADSGVYSMMYDGQFLWVGRRGGIRRYDKSGAWKFYLAKGCPGYRALGIASAAGKIWALFDNDGSPCVLDPATDAWHVPAEAKLDPATKTWKTIGDWKLLRHIHGGHIIRATGGKLLLNGEGGPDWEGISIVDPASEKWLKLIVTKPVQAFWADDKEIWAGVPEGILRIDRASEGYRYFLPTEHGCGSVVSSIVGTSAGIFAGTAPGTDAELGLAMRVYKDSIDVLTRVPGLRYSWKWVSYRRSDRRKLLNDITQDVLDTRDINTPGGLCRWDGQKWQGIFTGQGLPDNAVTALAADQNYLYAGTIKGLAVLDLKTLRVVSTIPEIASPATLTADASGLWVSAPPLVYHIDKTILLKKR